MDIDGERFQHATEASIHADGSGRDEIAAIGCDDVLAEMLMMGLRLAEGIARSRLEEAAGGDVEWRFADALPRLIESGFLTLDAERLAATAAGRQRLNAVLAALLG